jgi:polynucleotide 5'-hydroxyl-kinase GRC3/NOL9
MLNALLNHYPVVAYLDTDVGQPEFTTSGVVSLHCITQPVFGPSFTHLSLPYRAVYLGTDTIKDDPDAYLDAVHDLFHVYKNELALLTQLPECVPGLKQPFDHIARIPLVVNTHGWVKGLGHNALTHIFEFIRPNSIVSLAHSSDAHLNLQLSFPCNVIESISQAPDVQTARRTGTSVSVTRLLKHSSHDKRQLSLLSWLFAEPFHVSGWSCERVERWSFQQHITAMRPWTVPLLSKDGQGGLTLFLQHGHVEPSLVWRALNATLVGLYRPTHPIELDQPTIHTQPVTTTQQLSYVGVALVRSVDPLRQHVHLLTGPLSAHNVQHDVCALVRSLSASSIASIPSFLFTDMDLRVYHQWNTGDTSALPYQFTANNTSLGLWKARQQLVRRRLHKP